MNIRRVRIPPRMLARVSLALLALCLVAVFSPGRADAATVYIEASDIYFCSPSYYYGVCPVTISTGDTVIWDFSGSYHTATECGGLSCDDAPPPSPLFDSGVIFGTGTYSYTFSTPGTFLYECTVHGYAMRGQITVVSSVGGVAELAVAPAAPLTQPGARGSSWWVTAATVLLGVGAAAFAAAAAWYAARRRRS